MKNTVVKHKKSKPRVWRENLVAYSFLAPSLIGVVVFSLIPLLMSLYVSLTDWNFTKGIGNWNFIGLENFRNLFKDEWFIASMNSAIRK